MTDSILRISFTLLTSLLLLTGSAAAEIKPATAFSDHTVSKEDSAAYREVLTLNPLAFWPADEGKGSVLHDRTGHGNNARIFHVPWKEGLLNFTPAFQWAELPGKKGLLDQCFSIGGWIFSRSPQYTGAGALFMSFQKPTRSWETPNLFMRLRSNSEIEITLDNAKDSLGSLAAKDTVAINQWQHLFFTYNNGIAKLYVNGKLTQSKEDVPFAYDKERVLQMGGCGQGWKVYPTKVNSFQGSMSGMVLFDRALNINELEKLLAATQPTRTPKAFSSNALVFNGAFVNDNIIPKKGFVAGPIVFEGEEIAYGSLASRSLAFRYRMLHTLILNRNNARRIIPTLDWLPDLTEALTDWQTRWPAAALLMDIKDPKATAVLIEALPHWIETLNNVNSSRDERAACARAMSVMGKNAAKAIPALTASLNIIVKEQGIRIPRVDDILRNAIIHALFQIDPEDKESDAALSTAFSEPIINSLDLSNPFYATVKPLAAAGQYMKALKELRKLKPGRQAGERYFSQGDLFRDARKPSHNRAYSPKAKYKGFTYSLGHGISPHVAEPVSKEDFQKAVRSLSTICPQAATWRDPDAPNICRLKINKCDAAGNVESAYLMNENFMFDGTDGKIRGWSIGVDSDGYLHVIGGQHNYANTGHFISGSFQKMGLSEKERRDAKFNSHNRIGHNPKYPAHMYWVSKEPGNINDFEFVGSYDNPRKITPAECVNYMNFIQDNNGVLYCYFRTVSIGFHSFGVHRYNTKTRRWNAIGGDACDLIATAEKENPEWRKLLVRAVRNGIPRGPEYKSLIWAWQPGFYNYMRSDWGIKFDRTNRMHIEMAIHGLSDNARIIDSSIYAYSDDGGKSFHRADGSKVKLPLTNNPIQDYNADQSASVVGSYWLLWKSVLKDAGYLDAR